MPNYPKVQQEISDPISENLAKLAELFPAAVQDGALNMEALRAELGEFKEIKPGDETHELNWVGKQAAKKEAFKPPLGKTLALKTDGKNNEITQNLYIEGDNLEALKLLRQNYYGEVKMIYIDPPYNTGNDFVYTDKFAVALGESEEEEGAISNEGKRLVKNEKTSNRFHAKWLDMIYPRLKIAKDMLCEDGIIFISIDDNEMANLRQVCDEVFGGDRILGVFLWQRRQRADNRNQTRVSPDHEYILAYGKSAKTILKGEKIDTEKYTNPDNDPRGPWASIDLSGLATATQRPNLHYDIVDPKTGISYPPNPSRGWSKSKDNVLNMIEEGRILFPKSPTGRPREKKFLEDLKSDVTGFSTCLDSQVVGFTTNGTRELTEIIQGKFFDFPKPSQLIKLLAEQTTSASDIVFDFFSGSATTAHSVMRLNAEDGGNRRFIMVQLPEICAEDSEAAKAGYKTIAEIGKERIRRAGEEIKEELKDMHANWQKQQSIESKKGGKLDLKDGEECEDAPNPYVINPDALDIGFKSFRIEDTKINWIKKDLRGEQLEFSDTTTQDALDFVPGYTDIDVVYELMLRQSNIPLTGTITKPIATAKRTYLYADAYLICLEEKITQKLIESLATIEPTPNKYFFRDSAFGTDIALKDETFRRLKAEIHKHHGDLGAAYTVEFI